MAFGAPRNGQPRVGRGAGVLLEAGVDGEFAQIGDAQIGDAGVGG